MAARTKEVALVGLDKGVAELLLRDLYGHDFRLEVSLAYGPNGEVVVQIDTDREWDEHEEIRVWVNDYLVRIPAEGESTVERSRRPRKERR